MKLCKDCQFMEKQAMQVGPSAQMVPHCMHEECRHPVYGDPVPCQVARQEIVFCGFKAQYWKKKEEQQKPTTLVQLS